MEDIHKSVFLVVGPLRGGGGGKTPQPLSKKTFFVKGKNVRKIYEPLRSRGGGTQT